MTVHQSCQSVFEIIKDIGYGGIVRCIDNASDFEDTFELQEKLQKLLPILREIELND